MSRVCHANLSIVKSQSSGLCHLMLAIARAFARPLKICQSWLVQSQSQVPPQRASGLPPLKLTPATTAVITYTIAGAFTGVSRLLRRIGL
jgi:hypothetical protein